MAFAQPHTRHGDPGHSSLAGRPWRVCTSAQRLSGAALLRGEGRGADSEPGSAELALVFLGTSGGRGACNQGISPAFPAAPQEASAHQVGGALAGWVVRAAVMAEPLALRTTWLGQQREPDGGSRLLKPRGRVRHG